tara:strand:- start:67 stop:819 length:753 start_codon:yes stop_codon:yes gene_type:complete
MNKKFVNNYKLTNIYNNNKFNKISSQLLFGESFYVIRKYYNYLYIRTSYDNYYGYIKNKKYNLFKKTPTHQVITKDVNLHKFSNNNFITAKKKLLFGSKLIVSETKSNFSKVGKFWIKNINIFSLKKKIQFPLKYLKVYKNTKYVWGGISTNGIDCSGLVQSIYKLNRQYFPRDTKDQIKFIKDKISLKYSKNGDLFFWKGHIGIKINRQCLMHAYGPKKKVVISKIDKIISELQSKHLNLLAIKRYKLK